MNKYLKKEYLFYTVPFQPLLAAVHCDGEFVMEGKGKIFVPQMCLLLLRGCMTRRNNIKCCGAMQ